MNESESETLDIIAAEARGQQAPSERVLIYDLKRKLIGDIIRAIGQAKSMLTAGEVSIGTITGMSAHLLMPSTAAVCSIMTTATIMRALEIKVKAGQSLEVLLGDKNNFLSDESLVNAIALIFHQLMMERPDDGRFVGLANKDADALIDEMKRYLLTLIDTYRLKTT